ncbi:reverse transcriptase [Phytophthora megakarya]|uniref:Reverse transcriptase n=1 Tax=Phytophthora megakarya TaxID=4795 RepID=A0A225W8J3_9STRA|nr:reverse transcriptase [Phytophthora megakarya]
MVGGGGMPWLARHDPIIDWEKRTVVRFGRCGATESDGPVSAADTPSGASEPPSETVAPVAVSGRKAWSARAVTTPGVVDRKGVSGEGSDTTKKFSAVRRRGDNGVSTLRVANTLLHPGLHEAGRDQAGLNDACPRVQEPAGDRPQTGMSAVGIKEHSSMAGPGRKASESGIHKKKRRRKHNMLRKSRSGTETLQGMSAGQTQEPTVVVETLNVLT